MAMSLFQNASPEQMLEGTRKYMVKDVEAAATAASEAGLDIASFEQTIKFFR